MTAPIAYTGQDGKRSFVTEDNPIPTRAKGFVHWRSGFSKVLAATWDPQDWTLVGAIGAGQSANQAAGAGNIVAGTTANAETLFRSKFKCVGPMQFRAWMQLPNRQVNQSFYAEMVDVIGDLLAFTILSTTSVQVFIPGHTFTTENIGQSMTLGAVQGTAVIPGRYAIAAVDASSVTFTVTAGPASGSGTCSLFGWNFARITLDGAVGASAKFDCARNGWATGDTTITINTSASPGTLVKVSLLENFAYVFDQLSASSTTGGFAQRGSRARNLPDDDVELYLQFRVLNGTTAPGINTTLTVDSVAIEDVEVTACEIMPSQGLGNGTQVTVTGIPAVTLSGVANGVQGAGAHSAAVAGSPVRVGGKGISAIDTTIATGDTSDLITDLSGRLINNPDGCIPELAWKFVSAGTAFSATADTAAAAAAGASIRRRALWGRFRNTSATAGYLILKDGATEIDRIPLPASMTTSVEYQFGPNVRTTANAAFNVACSVASMAVDHSLYGCNEI